MSTRFPASWLPQYGELNQLIVEFVRSSGMELMRMEKIWVANIWGPDGQLLTTLAYFTNSQKLTSRDQNSLYCATIPMGRWWYFGPTLGKDTRHSRTRQSEYWVLRLTIWFQAVGEEGVRSWDYPIPRWSWALAWASLEEIPVLSCEEMDNSLFESVEHSSYCENSEKGDELWAVMVSESHCDCNL